MSHRIRIAILGDSPCGRCFAACCKQNGHDYAVLLRNDDEKRRFAPWSAEVSLRGEDGRAVVEQVLPYVNGRCQFLDDEDRCRVYDDRPQACRTFQCVSDFHTAGFGRHGRFIQLNPKVRDLLESL